MAKDIGRRAKWSFGRIEIHRVQPDTDQLHAEFDGEPLQNLTKQTVASKGKWDAADAAHF